MAAVLVVDDAPFHRRLLSTLLDDVHEVVDTAASGVEAVDRHEALDPAVVLMGWDLPIRDGVTAAEEIIESDSTTSVILFGEAPDPDRRAEAASAGVSEHLVLPLRRRGVLAAIDGTSGDRHAHESQ